MTAIIFAGPSLPPKLRPAADPSLEWRPPVRQGELYRAALARPAIIGVVDGYFEVVPTVWHKEILWAMAEGIHVYGAASLGALRAAELDSFGMKGIGRVYEAFRDGLIEDDDEVAVLHGPEELGYPPVTEAMVNIRATLAAAARAGLTRRRGGGVPDRDRQAPVLQGTQLRSHARQCRRRRLAGRNVRGLRRLAAARPDRAEAVATPRQCSPRSAPTSPPAPQAARLFGALPKPPPGGLRDATRYDVTA